MFVLNNAWKTVIRNKGRNILIVLIVAIIAAAATIGLAIRNATDNARETGLVNTSVTATISVDRSKLMEQARESQSSDSSSGSSDSSDSDSAPDFDAMRGALDSSNLTLADYQKYAKASSVSVSSYYSESTGVSGTGSFQPVETSTANAANSSDSSSDSGSSNQQGQGGPGGDMGGGPGGSGASGGNTSTGNGDSSSNSSGDSGSSSVDGSDSYNSESGSSGNDSSSGNGDSQGGQPGGMCGGMSQAVDYVSEINATVNLAVVGQLILIGLGLTLISVLVGIVFVMRYEPLQILADRSRSIHALAGGGYRLADWGWPYSPSPSNHPQSASLTAPASGSKT